MVFLGKIYIMVLIVYHSMKTKKPSMEKLAKMLEAIHKDPKLMKMAKKFVSNLGGKA